MKIQLFQIDAFTGKVFSGNPAAVCPLDEWIDDDIMQAIAMENNLSETAFFVKEGSDYRIRWFTPAVEVDLCGHATLASAFVIFNYLNYPNDEIVFHSRSGKLSVRKQNDLLEMDFPAQPPEPCDAPDDLISGLGVKPFKTLRSEDYFAVFRREDQVVGLKPDMQRLAKLGLRGVIATAKSDRADFVSRFFAPGVGIDEDPVTGSAHCALIPYWANRLQKIRLHALQISQRGGELFCQLRDDRVIIAGRAICFLRGKINLKD